MNMIKRFFARFRRQPAATPVPTPPPVRDHLDLMRHTYRLPEHSAAQRKRNARAQSAAAVPVSTSRRSTDDSKSYPGAPSFVPLIIDDPLPVSEPGSCSRADYDAPTSGGGSFSGAGASGDWSSSSSSSYDSGSSSSDSSSSSSYD